MENIKRIVVADTGTEFRKSVVRTLNDEPGLRVIGETGDGSELLHMVRDLQPDAVVMELVLTGGMDGLDVLEEFAQLQSRPRVLILSGYIKGSVVDVSVSDPNNDGAQDLVVSVNSYPGSLGMGKIRNMVLLYPLGEGN